MNTISTKQSEVEKKWILIDATDVVVGRVASYIANRLRGKHLVSFTPHVDDGDHVVVINAEKIHFTGNKLTDKKYYKHTGYPGGLKSVNAEKILESENPEKVLKLAVKRMLADNKLSRDQMVNLRVFPEAEHTLHAQKPKVINFAGMNNKNT